MMDIGALIDGLPDQEQENLFGGFHGSHRDLRAEAIEDRRAVEGRHPVNSQLMLNKRRVKEKLGNKCTNCGLDDVRLLDVHHVHHDGKTEREAGSIPYWRKIWREVNNGSDRYTLLCKNCHYAHHYF